LLPVAVLVSSGVRSVTVSVPTGTVATIELSERLTIHDEFELTAGGVHVILTLCGASHAAVAVAGATGSEA